MEIKVYKKLPSYAIDIRTAVFIEEQGFYNEFDKIDDEAIHIVVFEETRIPIATCRIFLDETKKFYILGRLAVVKEYRGRGIGALILKAAENYVRKVGGNHFALHAQCQAVKFYRKLGFEEFGMIEEDEGCPHIWMKKEL